MVQKPNHEILLTIFVALFRSFWPSIYFFYHVCISNEFGGTTELSLPAPSGFSDFSAFKVGKMLLTDGPMHLAPPLQWEEEGLSVEGQPPDSQPVLRRPCMETRVWGWEGGATWPVTDQWHHSQIHIVTLPVYRRARLKTLPTQNFLDGR